MMAALSQPSYEGHEPHLSAWVSASAGSGKTTLLTRRVLHLLLQGGRDGLPPSILCLTFTRAAAAEMLARIQKELAAWAVADESALRDALAKDLGLKADPPMIKRAQKLFSQVLDRPDVLRVMTVHAYCQHILNRFPLEAGLTPGFSLLADREAETFYETLTARFLQMAAQDEACRRALAIVAEAMGVGRVRLLLRDVLAGAAKWKRVCARLADPAALQAELLRLAGLAREEEDADIIHAFAVSTPAQTLRYAADVMAGGKDGDRKIAAALAGWLADGAQDMRAFTAYGAAFFTKEGKLRARLITKDLALENPDVAAAIQAEAARLEAARRQLSAQRFVREQKALYVLAGCLLQMAEEEKRRAAVLTYDDLIVTTARLLRRSEMAEWILYKLDAAIDHILIDEAQDTSPEQWEVVLSLLQEFYSGEGARIHRRRTLFVVGDDKQSIFSFQGAARGTYLEVREFVLKKMREAEKTVGDLARHMSYRTVPELLEFVDSVFAEEAARAGVSAAGLRHQASRAHESGFVEIWPLIAPASPPAPACWQPALARDDTAAAEVQLAQRMAARIRHWLDSGAWLKSRNRPLHAGDIMVLLQRRSRLMLPIVRALKDAQIPIAGVDRMMLREQPAVQDIVSLCRFLLLPQDDLALAEVLRGPLVRLDDSDLFALAKGRSGSLWQALDGHAGLAPAREYLLGLLNAVDHVTPYRLIQRVLALPCPGDAFSGLHALTHRLGADAVDPLEELLTLALNAGASGSLQLFIQDLNASDSEIKRELSGAQGQVRVLTVHGAKGLEAPVVFLPDLMRDTGKLPGAPNLYWHETGLPLAAGEAHEPLLAARAQARLERNEESRRLLYVALTRARDAMILCGVGEDGQGGRGEERAPFWYELCAAAMEKLPAAVLPDESGASITCYGRRDAVFVPPAAEAMSSPPEADLPQWLRRPHLPEPAALVLNPSQLAAEGEEVEPPQLDARSSRYRRGVLLHRLLQYLPALDAARREEYATAYLARAMGGRPADVQVDVAEVLAVIGHPDFYPVFGAGSEAEVPVIGRVKGRVISGQIDRLVVKDDVVLVVDYKTNRPPPLRVADVPPAYLAQMAAYRRLLHAIYPGREIRCALLWTHVLRLMELDSAALAAGDAILEKAA